MNSPITNMFSHIKNCLLIKTHIIYVPYSSYKLRLALIIKRCKFFRNVSVAKHDNLRAQILIEPKYISNNSLIQDIIMISTKRVSWNKLQLNQCLE